MPSKSIYNHSTSIWFSHVIENIVHNCELQGSVVFNVAQRENVLSRKWKLVFWILAINFPTPQITYQWPLPMFKNVSVHYDHTVALTVFLEPLSSWKLKVHHILKSLVTWNRFSSKIVLCLNQKSLYLTGLPAQTRNLTLQFDLYSYCIDTRHKYIHFRGNKIIDKTEFTCI